MLLGLGHDPFVRRHHEERQVYAARPCQHVADELFVAGYVDDARLLTIRQAEVGKAQLDGDATTFFLF